MIYMISIGTFRIGQLTITPGARDQLSPDEIFAAVQRHANCDWGDLCKEDKKQNESNDDIRSNGRHKGYSY